MDNLFKVVEHFKEIDEYMFVSHFLSASEFEESILPIGRIAKPILPIGRIVC
jgi:hypothetical protein